MSEAANTLDYLNDDCWRAIFGYLSVLTMMRTERISKRWQRLVLEYLSHVRIGICWSLVYEGLTGTKEMVLNVHWLELPEEYIPSFETWTYKLGSSVVACYCTERSLEIIGQNCPNLETVMFLRVEEHSLNNQSISQYENFTRLRGLRFEHCVSISDNSVKQFLVSTALEALEFHYNGRMTGECFKNIKSNNLKSLVFERCKLLQCDQLITAADRFRSVTKFVLSNVNEDNFAPEDSWLHQDIFRVLDKMPKLEHLEIYEYDGEMHIDNFFEFVCRCSSLKHLRVDFPVSDETLEAVARSCPELRSLELEGCGVSGRGLTALCAHAGPRLTALGVGNSSLVDDDVINCVRASPNLVEIAVPYMKQGCLRYEDI